MVIAINGLAPIRRTNISPSRALIVGRWGRHEEVILLGLGNQANPLDRGSI